MNNPRQFKLRLVPVERDYVPKSPEEMARGREHKALIMSALDNAKATIQKEWDKKAATGAETF